MCRRVFALLLALALAAPVAAPHAHGARGHVSSVGPIAMTVASADRSAAFYSDVLGFEKVSDAEVGGEPWERLYRVAKPRLRVVQLRLGDERIELIEFLTPRGRPIPADSR